MSRARVARAMAGGTAAALGAVWAGRERKRLQAAATAARAGEQQALAERDRLRGALTRRDQDVARRGQLIERLQRSRRAEREWNHELRAQLQRAQASTGGLSGNADVHELVLAAAIELVGARKGLLLSRADANADGDLDLVCAHGFAGKAGDSPLAQRFAHEVIERDRIVREDTPPAEDHGADAEIDNLIAIPLYLLDRFEGVIVCANRDGGFEDLDDDVLLALGDHAGAALQTQRLHNDLRQSYRAAVQMLAELVEARAPLAYREAQETALLAQMLGRRFGLEEGELEIVSDAALLRDVGQLTVPDHVLGKLGPLSPEERSVVELHPRTGFRLIGRISALSDVAAAVLYHHERYDGTGYPAKLAGAAIPRAARIVAIADAYIAMTHERPYRAPRSPEEALAELAAGAGTHFDPELTQIFLEELRRGAPALLLREPAGEDKLPERVADVPASDPLTLLPGHRAFREAVQRAATEDGGFIVAMVEIQGLEEVNARDGYSAGDRAIVKAARGAQLAAERVGGRAYRDSGRRVAILVPAHPESRQPDVAGELHLQFALGPPVRLGVAVRRPGESGEKVVRRARGAIVTEIASHQQR
ncbi:MAG: HD domain-containing protein [Solirubrobacterales bacterium]|nr:HD domain-containing protein [Solirubrobacterales bacterium]